jgi:uncharacterized Ntn-hydrolase superfamily protein
MTFSLIARCKVTGRFGMVISSSSPAVAARCAHVRAKVGVVASQNITDPSLGPLILDALASGQAAEVALEQTVRGRAHIDYRQLLVMNREGPAAIFSGSHILGIWGQANGADCAAAGNLLANQGVPKAMVAAFESSSASFADRLIAALRAGRDAGGEAGPVHSAGLKIADQQAWPWADLRCDWLDDGCPIEAVARAWEVYAPQADAYVKRALNPTVAPSYGVPGDE